MALAGAGIRQTLRHLTNELKGHFLSPFTP